MKTFNKKILLTAIFCLILLTPVIASADIGNVLDSLDNTAQTARITEKDQPAVTIYDIVGKFINLTLTFLGVLFLILIIYGGIIWMTGGKSVSGGATKVDINKAKQIITQATMGLAIVLFAYLITNFVVFKVIGTTTGGETSQTPGNDLACTADPPDGLGGNCQMNSADCTGGTYVANKCLSDLDPNYQCCVVQAGP